MIKLPIFVKLNLNYPKDEIIQEIQKTREFWSETSVQLKNGHSEFCENGSLLEDAIGKENLANATYLDENRNLISGNNQTYHVCNLTWVPGHENSKKNIWYRDDQGNRQLYQYHYRNWEWREELQIKVLKEFINELGIELSQVRVIVIPPNGVGTIHRDSHPVSNITWLNNGGLSWTLNLQSGGANLLFEHKNQIHSTHGDAWHFRDYVLHGVEKTQSERIQLRLSGIMPIEKQMEFWDKNTAIY